MKSTETVKIMPAEHQNLCIFQRCGLELVKVTALMTCSLTRQKINDSRLNIDVEVKDLRHDDAVSVVKTGK